MRGVDTLKRSIVKALIWRATGIALLGGISWIATHDPASTFSITAAFHGIRVVGYVIHERIWERVGWGRNGCPRCGLPAPSVLVRAPEGALTVSGDLAIGDGKYSIGDVAAYGPGGVTGRRASK